MYVEMNNKNNSSYIWPIHLLSVPMLNSSLHGVVFCTEVFCVLENDFSSLWSQLTSGQLFGVCFISKFSWGE